MPGYLTKSDFKVARTCGTKLYYRKLRYPSSSDDDEYLRFLADGGYIVEAIAKIQFPDGIEMPIDSTRDAIAETAEALLRTNVTLFEATLLAGRLLARVDILVKRGNSIQLIEVKAKSFDSSEGRPFRGQRGGIDSDWLPYLEDVAFQTLVVKRLYPGAEVSSCLCLVDRASTCAADAVHRNFEILNKTLAGNRTRRKVQYRGNPAMLRTDAFVKIVDVSAEVAELLENVAASADAFARALDTDPPRRIEPKLSVRCKSCEFRMQNSGARPDGFHECWGPMADSNPHLLDLYRVDLLGKHGEIAQLLIDQQKSSLSDVAIRDLRGKTGERQAIQLEWTRRGEEFISAALPALLQRCPYPLHFVDFEASRLAVPYHAGMRPYEQVLFQWSCHSIAEPGGPLEHSEWINVESAFPNFEFARTLRAALNEAETVFVWSPFEQTGLKEVRRQLQQYRHGDPELAEWLDWIVRDHGLFIDLCELAKVHYFHPRMKGSLSIKDVLLAVWSASPALRAHPWFSEYFGERDGRILEPYEMLQPLPFGNDPEEDVTDVREGTAAMRTYQEMLYGVKSTDPSFRDAQRQALLRYCKLDTAAMVMIWLRWTRQA